MITRRFCLALLGSLIFASAAQGQYKLETCEDLKITEKRYGVNVIETAACVNSTKALSPKGTLRNVNILYSFPPVPTGAGVTFMVTKDNADGEYVQNIDYSVTPTHTTAYARLTINTPGKYFVRLVNYSTKRRFGPRLTSPSARTRSGRALWAIPPRAEARSASAKKLMTTGSASASRINGLRMCRSMCCLRIPRQ